MKDLRELFDRLERKHLGFKIELDEECIKYSYTIEDETYSKTSHIDEIFEFYLRELKLEAQEHYVTKVYK